MSQQFIQLLVDNKTSWFVPFAQTLEYELNLLGFKAELIYVHADIKKCDHLFLLSCTLLLKDNFLEIPRNVYVIHGSDLPKGRGWSPLSWEIVSGCSTFTLSMINATKKIDSGAIRMKRQFTLSGTELINEAREIQAVHIVSMILDYVRYPELFPPIEQVGEASYYRRRTAADSEVDINKTIVSQFNNFRVADNERYPLFFRYKGKKFILKIFPGSEEL